MSNLRPDKNKKKDSQEKSSPEFLGMTQNITINNLDEHFPAIHAELTDKKMSLGISKVESEFDSSLKEQEEIKDIDPLSNYDPNVYDFLGRASTKEEGFEIIDFLVKRDQLTSDTALQLKEQIKKSGIRSFGPKRRSNHYFTKASEIRSRRIIKKRYSTRSKND